MQVIENLVIWFNYIDLKWYLGDGLLIIFDSFAVASKLYL